jgi:hypothetical protein
MGERKQVAGGHLKRLNAVLQRPSFGEALHLAHGGSTAGHLKALGAKRVLMMMDSLTTGPVSSNPAEHLDLRLAYWRNFYRGLPSPPGKKAPRFSVGSGPVGTLTSASDLKKGLRGRRTGEPLVLWSGARWDELLFAWWVCDALIRCEVSASDVWVASPTAVVTRHANRELQSPTHAQDEDLLQMFAASVQCTATLLRSGARLWAAFTKGDLGAIQRLRSHRTSSPPLGPIPAPAAALVPQVHHAGGKQRIGLSDYDRRLLGLFSSGKWSTAIGRLKDAGTSESYLSLMEAYGDLLIPERLNAWAAHGPDILEERPMRQARSTLDAVEYRLTTKGRAILKNGLPLPTAAPEISVGGFVAYAAAMNWACEVGDGKWRFVRLSG